MTFEWKGDMGACDPTPQLGVTLGLRFIKDAVKNAKSDFHVLWDDKNKGFVIVKPDRFGGSATAIVFSDLELLQLTPEALMDTFEARVTSAIMTLQQSAFLPRVKNSPVAEPGASQG